MPETTETGRLNIFPSSQTPEERRATTIDNYNRTLTEISIPSLNKFITKGEHKSIPVYRIALRTKTIELTVEEVEQMPAFVALQSLAAQHGASCEVVPIIENDKNVLDILITFPTAA